MKILGIDPGLQATGYGVVDGAGGGAHPALVEAGVIRTRGEEDLADRLVELHEGLVSVLADFDPDTVAVEELYAHYKHPRTAILMGHARGVIFLAAAEAGKPVASYNATKIKKSLTGSGHASKVQMQRAIQAAFGLAEPPEPADVADALAVALCHAHRTVRITHAP